MGEGGTPLVRLYNLENVLDWRGQLWAKAEYQNPTGSFKDRGSIVEITEAVRQKKRGVVCASTGNMAASLAAYAARAKLTCVVVLPESTPEAKLKQATMCDARLIKVSGSYDDCVAEAKKQAQKERLFLCDNGELRRIGQQSVGRELAKSNIRFDAFIAPVGVGTLGCAVAEGFSSCGQYPQFIGVQGSGADPIARAWQTNSSIVRIIEPKTVASAMCVGDPRDGERTLSWMRKTNGAMFSISDEEIIDAQTLLAKKEGIFAEKSAAATVAVLQKISRNYQIIAIILTGNGLKENEHRKDTDEA